MKRKSDDSSYANAGAGAGAGFFRQQLPIVQKSHPVIYLTFDSISAYINQKVRDAKSNEMTMELLASLNIERAINHKPGISITEYTKTYALQTIAKQISPDDFIEEYDVREKIQIGFQTVLALLYPEKYTLPVEKNCEKILKLCVNVVKYRFDEYAEIIRSASDVIGVYQKTMKSASEHPGKKFNDDIYTLQRSKKGPSVKRDIFYDRPDFLGLDDVVEKSLVIEDIRSSLSLERVFELSFDALYYKEFSDLMRIIPKPGRGEFRLEDYVEDDRCIVDPDIQNKISPIIQRDLINKAWHSIDLLYAKILNPDIFTQVHKSPPNFTKSRKVFSLDYDGCHSVKYPQLRELELHGERSVYYKQNSPKAEANLQIVSERYQEFLNELKADATEISVYVGSNRQSYSSNKFNQSINRNGCAFQMLQKFCQEQTRTSTEIWTFEPYLLADQNHPRGEALRRMELLDGETPDDLDYLDRQLHAYGQSLSKVELILKQMKDARKQYPDTEIDFHFVDDQMKILEDIATNLPRNKIPLGMTLTLSRFDYIGWIFGENGNVVPRMHILTRSEHSIALRDDVVAAAGMGLST